jgi:hypothetical protein
MGCGMSAVHDDENEWYRLKETCQIKDVKWDVYSQEAHHVKAGWLAYKHTGRRLKLYVRQEMEMADLKAKHKSEMEKLNSLIAFEASLE